MGMNEGRRFVWSLAAKSVALVLVVGCATPLVYEFPGLPPVHSGGLELAVDSVQKSGNDLTVILRATNLTNDVLQLSRESQILVDINNPDGLGEVDTELQVPGIFGTITIGDPFEGRFSWGVLGLDGPDAEPLYLLARESAMLELLFAVPRNEPARSLAIRVVLDGRWTSNSTATFVPVASADFDLELPPKRPSPAEG